ncbi:hypothetical protein FW778_10790 [Ginsengibacter hankyongi]|uniref:Dolichyl-phosphate-mannose-protein mannosyltransferase n=1 Tax=Ginsengibacter hankyongi TaxID=2607284 RepID=A0A5J5IJX4_9BACT|nr:hypothetical protein [Ginsengibacter hankyongi]KAA9039309.1 hypothetical protein FW778_10790 [Ginsengibacter hankyongi]
MMKKIKSIKNPFLIFLPFLILLMIYALLNPTSGNGDEHRYLTFAHNLINGFYSPPPPNINLTNGPGYPIILAPFVALKLPLAYITLLNPFLYYFSIIFLFKALKQVVSYKTTLIFSFLWACYYIAYQNIVFVMTETLTYFLISVLIYSLVRAFLPGKSIVIRKYIILSGFIFGYIVLTKIAFIYVLLTLLFGSIIFWIFNTKESNYKKLTAVTSIALLTILPYLVYAYFLTGQMFYWNTNTGDSLYWNSTPFSNEYGDWKDDLTQGPPDLSNYNIPGAQDTLIAHHQKDFDIINRYSGRKRDDVFKQIAIRNIKTHPSKFLLNCFYNAGRLLFHYPFSQAIQRPKILLVFPLNGIILTLMLFSLIPTFLNWRNISLPLKFLLIFAFLYLGMSTLVSALVRMFTVIVPILIFWFGYIFDKSVKINLRFNEKL